MAHVSGNTNDDGLVVLLLLSLLEIEGQPLADRMDVLQIEPEEDEDVLAVV